MGRDHRNFGCGRTLSEQTLNRLAIASAKARGNGSESIDKANTCLRDFVKFLDDQYPGIKCLEAVTQDVLNQYAANLAEQVWGGDIGTGTSANRISVLNQIFQLDPTHRGLKLSAREHGISNENRTSWKNKAIEKPMQNKIMAHIVGEYRKTGDIRYLALGHMIDMERAGGSRFKESALMDLRSANFETGRVTLRGEDGTKNDRPRTFEPANGGLDAFKAAQIFVLNNPGMFTRGTLVPMTENYKTWTNWTDKRMREINHAVGNDKKYHGFRHHYAHESYAEKWQIRTGIRVECTVAAGCTAKGQWKQYASKLTGLSPAECRRIDKEIRAGMKGTDGKTILKNGVTQELGHSRLDVTNSYCGPSV